MTMLGTSSYIPALRRGLRRGLATLVSAALVLTTVPGPGASASGTTALPPLPQFRLAPPSALGQVADYFNAPQTDSKAPAPLVVLIQDLHADYGAQKSIADLLGFLKERLAGAAQTSLPFALLTEGGSGPVDLSALASFPDPKVKAVAADYLLREAMLSGAEYFAVLQSAGHAVQGAEDEARYTQHERLYRETYQARRQLTTALGEMRKSLPSLRAKMYPWSLKQFQRTIDAHDDGRMPTEEYLARLMAEAKRQSVALDKEFPALARFVQAGAVDGDRLRAQVAELLTAVQTQLTSQERQSLAAFAKSAPEDYFLYLGDLIQSHRLFLAVPPALAGYIDHLRTMRSLQMNPVLFDASELAWRLKQGLARKTASGADLVSLEHDLDVLTRVCALQATEDQVRAFAPRFDQFLALAKTMLGDGIDEATLRRLISSSLDYYVMAMLRNRPMIDKTVVELKKQDVAVLVTGGFHTASLAQRLRDKGVSYIVLTPAIAALTSGSQALYEKRLCGETLDEAAVFAAGHTRTSPLYAALAATEGSSPHRGARSLLARFAKQPAPHETLAMRAGRITLGVAAAALATAGAVYYHVPVSDYLKTVESSFKGLSGLQALLGAAGGPAFWAKIANLAGAAVASAAIWSGTSDDSEDAPRVKVPKVGDKANSKEDVVRAILMSTRREAEKAILFQRSGPVIRAMIKEDLIARGVRLEVGTGRVATRGSNKIEEKTTVRDLVVRLGLRKAGMAAHEWLRVQQVQWLIYWGESPALLETAPFARQFELAAHAFGFSIALRTFDLWGALVNGLGWAAWWAGLGPVVSSTSRGLDTSSPGIEETAAAETPLNPRVANDPEGPRTSGQPEGPLPPIDPSRPGAPRMRPDPEVPQGAVPPPDWKNKALPFPAWEQWTMISQGADWSEQGRRITASVLPLQIRLFLEDKRLDPALLPTLVDLARKHARAMTDNPLSVSLHEKARIKDLQSAISGGKETWARELDVIIRQNLALGDQLADARRKPTTTPDRLGRLVGQARFGLYRLPGAQATLLAYYAEWTRPTAATERPATPAAPTNADIAAEVVREASKPGFAQPIQQWTRMIPPSMLIGATVGDALRSLAGPQGSRLHNLLFTSGGQLRTHVAVYLNGVMLSSNVLETPINAGRDAIVIGEKLSGGSDRQERSREATLAKLVDDYGESLVKAHRVATTTRFSKYAPGTMVQSVVSRRPGEIVGDEGALYCNYLVLWDATTKKMAILHTNSDREFLIVGSSIRNAIRGLGINPSNRAHVQKRVRALVARGHAPTIPPDVLASLESEMTPEQMNELSIGITAALVKMVSEAGVSDIHVDSAREWGWDFAIRGVPNEGFVVSIPYTPLTKEFAKREPARIIDMRAPQARRRVRPQKTSKERAVPIVIDLQNLAGLVDDSHVFVTAANLEDALWAVADRYPVLAPYLLEGDNIHKDVVVRRGKTTVTKRTTLEAGWRLSLSVRNKDAKRDAANRRFTVLLPSDLTVFTGKQDRIEVSGANEGEVLAALVGRFRGLKGELMEGDVVSPRWSVHFNPEDRELAILPAAPSSSNLAHRRAPVMLTNEAFAVFGTKYLSRKLLADGDFPQPKVIALFQETPRAVAAAIQRHGEFRDLASETVLALADPADIHDVDAFAKQFAGGQLPEHLVYKPNAGAVGLGILFMKRGPTGAVELTMIRDQRGHTDDPSPAIEAYLKGIGVAVGLSSESSLMTATLDPAHVDVAATLAEILLRVSTFKSSFDGGMVEEFAPAFRYKGRAFETCFFVSGNYPDGSDFQIDKEDVAVGHGQVKKGAFARVGASGNFANRGGRENVEILPYRLMFNPLFETFGITDEDRQKAFRQYVDAALESEFRRQAATLGDHGVTGQFKVNMEMDLMWLPPTEPNGIPRPVFNEIKLTPITDGRSERLNVRPFGTGTIAEARPRTWNATRDDDAAQRAMLATLEAAVRELNEARKPVTKAVSAVQEIKEELQDLSDLIWLKTDTSRWDLEHAQEALPKALLQRMRVQSAVERHKEELTAEAQKAWADFRTLLNRHFELWQSLLDQERREQQADEDRRLGAPASVLVSPVFDAMPAEGIRLDVRSNTLETAIAGLTHAHPALRSQLFIATQLRPEIRILVNGTDVTARWLDILLARGDSIQITKQPSAQRKPSSGLSMPSGAISFALAGAAAAIERTFAFLPADTLAWLGRHVHAFEPFAPAIFGAVAVLATAVIVSRTFAKDVAGQRGATQGGVALVRQEAARRSIASGASQWLSSLTDPEAARERQSFLRGAARFTAQA